MTHAPDAQHRRLRSTYRQLKSRLQSLQVAAQSAPSTVPPPAMSPHSAAHGSFAVLPRRRPSVYRFSRSGRLPAGHGPSGVSVMSGSGGDAVGSSSGGGGGGSASGPGGGGAGGSSSPIKRQLSSITSTYDDLLRCLGYTAGGSHTQPHSQPHSQPPSLAMLAAYAVGRSTEDGDVEDTVPDHLAQDIRVGRMLADVVQSVSVRALVPCLVSVCVAYSANEQGIELLKRFWELSRAVQGGPSIGECYWAWTTAAKLRRQAAWAAFLSAWVLAQPACTDRVTGILCRVGRDDQAVLVESLLLASRRWQGDGVDSRESNGEGDGGRADVAVLTAVAIWWLKAFVAGHDSAYTAMGNRIADAVCSRLDTDRALEPCVAFAVLAAAVYAHTQSGVDDAGRHPRTAQHYTAALRIYAAAASDTATTTTTATDLLAYEYLAPVSVVGLASVARDTRSNVWQCQSIVAGVLNSMVDGDTAVASALRDALRGLQLPAIATPRCTYSWRYEALLGSWIPTPTHASAPGVQRNTIDLCTSPAGPPPPPPTHDSQQQQYLHESQPQPQLQPQLKLKQKQQGSPECRDPLTAPSTIERARRAYIERRLFKRSRGAGHGLRSPSVTTVSDAGSVSGNDSNNGSDSDSDSDGVLTPVSRRVVLVVESESDEPDEPADEGVGEQDGDGGEDGREGGREGGSDDPIEVDSDADSIVAAMATHRPPARDHREATWMYVASDTDIDDLLI
ncbi:hypothetical protein BC831DRAFT_547467 [Entophlyctis helioformis]|nr:hypothetical protein BC831DRAFT_547467 [Entophlyctis helioformis]